MTTRLGSITAVALLGLVVCASAHATLVAIYRNALDTTAERTDVLKLSGGNCSCEGSRGTLQITVGKRTADAATDRPEGIPRPRPPGRRRARSSSAPSSDQPSSAKPSTHS